MAYQFELFLQAVVILLLQGIAAILSILFLWQFLKRCTGKTLPSGPAAFGRGFCVIFIVLPMLLYVVWFCNKLFAGFGVTLNPTFVYLLMIILAPLVSGYLSTRSYEQAGLFSPTLVSSTAIIPYGLVVLFLGFDLTAIYKWFCLFLFIPLIFIGALLGRVKPTSNIKERPMG